MGFLKFAEIRFVDLHASQPNFLMLEQNPKLGMEDVKNGPPTSIRCAPLRATTR